MVLLYKIDFFKIFFLILYMYYVLIINTSSKLLFLYHRIYFLQVHHFFLKYLPNRNIHIKCDNCQ